MMLTNELAIDLPVMVWSEQWSPGWDCMAGAGRTASSAVGVTGGIGPERELFNTAHVPHRALCHARRMKPRKPARAVGRAAPAFNAQAFLDSSGLARTIGNTAEERPSSPRATPVKMSCTFKPAA